jgi:cytochrome c-type biogenesis protein CcmH/NrfF
MRVFAAGGVLMQNILPVLCFIAGFALAWLVLRWRRQETETQLRAETGKLVTALRTPGVRGR